MVRQSPFSQKDPSLPISPQSMWQNVWWSNETKLEVIWPSFVSIMSWSSQCTVLELMLLPEGWVMQQKGDFYVLCTQFPGIMHVIYKCLSRHSRTPYNTGKRQTYNGNQQCNKTLLHQDPTNIKIHNKFKLIYFETAIRVRQNRRA